MCDRTGQQFFGIYIGATIFKILLKKGGIFSIGTEWQNA